MINKFILIFFFLITTACDFKPIFSQKNEKIFNFGISKIDISGETIVNTIFRSGLVNYTKIKSENNYDIEICLLYTSPSPRDAHESRMPSSA